MYRASLTNIQPCRYEAYHFFFFLGPWTPLGSCSTIPPAHSYAVFFSPDFVLRSLPFLYSLYTKRHMIFLKSLLPPFVFIPKGNDQHTVASSHQHFLSPSHNQDIVLIYHVNLHSITLLLLILFPSSFYFIFSKGKEEETGHGRSGGTS